MEPATFQINEAFDNLMATGQAQVIERYGHRFWSAAAARYASAMLPGIFRVADPILQVRFAAEGRQA